MAFMAPSSLATQLMTVAVLSLQRQIAHNRGMNRDSWNPSYDFVVVGSGTAGSIVAARLTENPNVTVLLLEAGGPMTITSDIVPAFYWYNANWGYSTVPQEHAAFGLRNRQIGTPRGKILGGSHALMLNIHARGNSHDYDNWANYYGCRGWDYQSVLPFFLRSENNTDPALVAANSRYHSTTGPVEVSTLPNPDPILTRWLNIVHSLGWPLSDFSNSEHQYGVMIPQSTQSATNWTRQTTGTAFIEVNIARPNLHVILHAHVTRLLFSSNTTTTTRPTVTGVEFVRNNQTYQVSASREVILSAGSINTPQLLMLSGIGPRNHLTQMNISVIADLPVGSTLYDHVIIPFDYWVTNASDITWTGDLYNSINAPNLYDFMANSHGPLTRHAVTHTYIQTGISGTREWPDGMMYLMINQYSPSVEALLPNYDEQHRDQWRTYLRQFENDNRHFWFAFLNFRPVSSGTVRLASSNPFDAPLIDPKYFSNMQDLVALTRAISIGLQLAETEAAAPLFQYSKLPVPGCQFCPDRPLSQCYSYIACVCQTYTWTDYHVAGSVRMGNASSIDAVLNERLQVLGVNNLRVIDSSIMPRITNCNPNAPTMMIGERGVQFVKDDYGLANPA